MAGDVPTRALRANSPELLRSGLHRLLAQGEGRWSADVRDLLVALAPYHNCARRLGLDPRHLFDQAADEAPQALHEVVRAFGRRRGVTLETFGYRLARDAGGPLYEYVEPGPKSRAPES